MAKIVFLVFLFILFLFGIIQSNQTIDICFNNHCFSTEVVKTEQKREKGLMFRENMDLGKGMLFVFDKERERSFWMKNVLFPLDIIWIDQDKEIVFIKKNAQPCKDLCEGIKPNKKAKYVLEINAGAVDEIGISVGDKLEFRRKSFIDKFPF